MRTEAARACYTCHAPEAAANSDFPLYEKLGSDARGRTRRAWRALFDRGSNFSRASSRTDHALCTPALPAGAEPPPPILVAAALEGAELA